VLHAVAPRRAPQCLPNVRGGREGVQRGAHGAIADGVNRHRQLARVGLAHQPREGRRFGAHDARSPRDRERLLHPGRLRPQASVDKYLDPSQAQERVAKATAQPQREQAGQSLVVMKVADSDRQIAGQLKALQRRELGRCADVGHGAQPVPRCGRQRVTEKPRQGARFRLGSDIAHQRPRRFQQQAGRLPRQVADHAPAGWVGAGRIDTRALQRGGAGPAHVAVLVREQHGPLACRRVKLPTVESAAAPGVLIPPPTEDPGLWGEAGGAAAHGGQNLLEGFVAVEDELIALASVAEQMHMGVPPPRQHGAPLEVDGGGVPARARRT
jgi:hypothetical protein